MRRVARSSGAGRLAAWLVALGVLAAPALGHAQSTGGSFGGGHFGGGHSYGGHSYGGHSYGSSPRGSGWGSSSRSSGHWSTSSHYGYDDPLMPPPFVIAFAGIVGAGFVLVMTVALVREAVARRRKRFPPVVKALVSRITVGIDWRARRALQATLAKIAASGRTGTPEGRSKLLCEVVDALCRAELSWLYADGEADSRSLPGPQAEARFKAEVDDLRGRFRKELVRGAHGTLVENPTPALRAKASEGQGTVVVSLVLAVTRKLEDVRGLATADELRAALFDCLTIEPHELVALEVVWSPAAENDRMSTAELEQNYPELRLLDPDSVAGRVFCGFCNGPFARELGECPHCGAPAPKVEHGEA